jgi:arylsulfatase A-like enzyme
MRQEISRAASRIGMFAFVSVLTVLASTATGATNPEADARPNIILIVTDDQSPMPWPYSGGFRAAEPFGFCGESRVHTPAIDRLARDGLVFTRAYVSSSVCSPSRYATLTGRYAGRCTGPRFMRLHPPGTMTRVENNTELEHGRPNLPTVLREHGYRTGFVGKCHIVSHDILNAPQTWSRNGMQEYAMDADPQKPGITARMRHNHQQWCKRIAAYGFDVVDAVYAANLRELYNKPADVHNVEWTTAAALRFIETSREQPFFLYYATTVPHGPAPWIRRDGKYIHGLDAPPEMTGEGYVPQDYDFMPSRGVIQEAVRRQGKPAETAWIHWFDAAVGALRSKLEQLDLLDNTLIIITSDHGSWRHGKSTLHEGGLRVPMLMHWPAGLARSGSYDGLVQNIDLAPTILSLAKIQPPDGMRFDGFSLVPVLRGSKSPSRSHLFAEVGYSRCVITNDWKYIAVRYDPEIAQRIEAGATFPGFEGRVLRRPYLTRNGHLGHHASSHNPHYFEADQLYNLVNDPREETNVAADRPEKVAEMQHILRGYLQSFKGCPFGEFVPE